MDVDLVELAGHRGKLAEGTAVDPVTAEVIRGAMETVCWEMATYVSRTATTPSAPSSGEPTLRRRPTLEATAPRALWDPVASRS